MFVECIGLGPVDCAFKMLGRPVDCTKALRFRSRIDGIMPCTRRNDHSVVGLYLNGLIVVPDLTASRFEAKELIAGTVDFFADLFARLECHQHRLNDLPV